MAYVTEEEISSPFNFSYPISLPSLKISLSDLGQINPILIADTESEVFIIDGFRRYNILKQLGAYPIFFKVRPLHIENALNVYLAINLESRRFNIIEKIRICRFVISNKINISEQTLQKAGLGDIYKNSGLYEFIENLNDDLKDIIVEKRLTTSLIERLLKIGYTNSEKILLYARDKSLTHQQTREVITDLYLLTMKGVDIGQIINALTEISFEELKRKIRGIKNPLLQKMEDEFKDFIKDIKNLSIHPPENFEGNNYILEGRFRDENDLEQILKEISEIKERWKRNPILK
ncbi:MAG: ParB N-terminal domain-containing protein [Myxococcota bacterium]